MLFFEPDNRPKRDRVLRKLWTYVVKNDGNKEARGWCGVYTLKGNGCQFTNNYEECVSHNRINMCYHINRFEI